MGPGLRPRSARAHPCVLLTALLIGVFSVAAGSDRSDSSERLERIFGGREAPDGTADLAAMQERFREVSRRVVPCTVGVRAGGGQGSGVIVSEDGYVLTAGHVSARPGRTVTLIFHDGRQVKAETLGVNHGIDSGLLKITEEGKWPFVEMGKSGELAEGQWCLATGHPGGYQPGRAPPVRVGRVLRNRSSAVTTDCVLVGGDSGGPLFDMNGRVIGINSRISQSFAANVHVPVDTFTETWERLKKGESWGQRGRGSVPTRGGPYLGVTSDSDSDNCRIGGVTDGSPAEAAGLQTGDVITQADGEPIETFQDLATRVRKKKPGDEIILEVRRDDTTFSVKVKIGKYEGSSVPPDPERPTGGLDLEDPPKKKDDDKDDDDKDDDERSERRERGVERLRRSFDQMRRRERGREPRRTEKRHSSIRDAFRDSVEAAAKGTVQILCDGDEKAFGALIDASGHVITKASEMRGDIRCKLHGGRETSARIVASSDKHDIALLALDLDGEDGLGEARPIVWATGDEPSVGSWVVTTGYTEDAVSFGVVSVASRALGQRGILGISFKMGDERAVVGEVIEDSGASRAGLQPNDVITALDGDRVETGPDLVELLRARSPGDEVKLSIRRGDEDIEVTAKLGSRLPASRQQRLDRMNLLGGEVSTRRSNFPLALQHDTVLWPDQCGGPIVQLDGQVVGLNIARSGRVDSYAIPASVLRSIVAELRPTAPLNPLADLSIDELRQRLEALEKSLAAAEASKREAETMIRSAISGIAELRKEVEKRAAKVKREARRKRL